MQLRAPIRLLIALVAILASAPAFAQVYKWVDERGVTNYSSQPPDDATKKVAIVEDRISVYTPDKALTQAIEAARQGSNQALSERVASLERQLEDERRARQYVSAAPAAYDPCQGGRAIDCSGFYGGYYPYYPVYAIAPYRHLRGHFVQTRLKPGTLPANVVGTNGFIPGNSASAGNMFPARTFQTVSTSRGFPPR